MKILGIIGASLGLALCGTLPAKASTVEYAFSFTGAPFDGSGDIFVDSQNDAITKITGSITGPSGGTIAEIPGSGLFLGGNQLWSYDNILHTAGIPFDDLGALFSFGSHGIGNIYSIGNQLLLSVSEPGGLFDTEKIQLTVSQTPIPPALPMFLTALGGLWFVVRRRNGKAAHKGHAFEHFATT